MPASVRLLAAATAVAACVGVQAVPASAATTAPAEVSRGVAIPAFYDPPHRLPDANGALVRSEHLPLALSLPGLYGPLPGTATRIMYRTTDSGGRPAAATGAYIEPTARWRGAGPRPLVVLAPGTMGQGDQCAASLGLQHPITFNGRTLSVGYEDLAIYRLLARGVAVVVTDYIGLGTTDRLHTYVNRVDEGHAVLDAVRAARALPHASVTAASRVGLYGYSQGGGATASAAELRASYAPDVHLSGTYAGAPPADLSETTKGIDGTDLAGALGWSLNGFLQSDPDLRPVAEAHLNDKGRAALKDLSTMCVGDAILAYHSVHSSSWTTDGKSLAQVIAAEPRLRAFLAEQRIGRIEPSGPVRVATGVHDNLVPHAQARRLAVDWCGKGAQVTYVPVRVPSLGRALINHFVPLVADQGPAIRWLTDRLSGKPATSDCASLPARP
ncbi:lipase family protein [Streptomyces beihaiensis]|uniref:Lipase family protein n=1 Tax=Streptomyces beihaiensis TaxID=2984495 RepID=A0ABT3TX55_9ACTN|nr:lipase family protein [Streptomyces beihaiensis]MCX3061628.1 lipase family protein [Streptomyces beihaiensis]